MLESRSIAANPARSPFAGSGNYVVLRIGPRRYAVYEHLRPGSIKVRRGDRVRVGQVIAALGFTGNSTGPHLHLHVTDCPSPIGCEGLPFTVTGMSELGRYADLSGLGVGRWNVSGARGAIAAEWAGYNVVVSFPR